MEQHQLTQPITKYTIIYDQSDHEWQLRSSKDGLIFSHADRDAVVDELQLRLKKDIATSTVTTV